MRSIVLVTSVETQNWKFCFNHHGVVYTEIDYWDNPSNLDKIHDSFLISDYNTVEHLWKYQKENFKKILAKNKIFLVGLTDAPVIFRNSISWLRDIDQLGDSINITCVIECDNFDHTFHNIQFDFDLESRFFDITEQRVTVRLEKNYSKDFFLCIGRKTNDRDMLWNEFVNHVKHDNSIMIYRQKHFTDYNWEGYIGQNSAPLLLQRTLVPSLDIYNDCCFEVSTETILDGPCWFTEKTIRSLAAKTPILILGVPGTLARLKNLGFKTFDKLINESYDNDHDVQTRIRKIANIANDIVSSGSKLFALSAQDIVEHNWNRLIEIKSAFHLKKDRRYFDLVRL